MCGITGFVEHRDPLAGLATLERMCASIRHRGPDATGTFHEPPAFLSHQRLSIIDLATGGQPMFNEDGYLSIVYNGEIFNHSDLRSGLEAAGHVYHTHCDTETILHAYEQHGPACLERFRGMFAFAIWDRRARTLFCARDRLGIKPFYYFWDGRVFAFASEIKALLEHPAIPARLEEEALPEYLAFGYLSGERTLFAGIRKLMPGHHLTLTWDENQPRLSISRYWDVPQPPAEPERRDDASWIRECRDRLEETVRMRLMSDVPLGMFLSGGVDSSAIAALMKRMVTGRIKTFSVGYRETAFSELGYAREVARFLDTDHHEVVIGMEDFFDALPNLIWHEDEPITWPSSVSLHFVSRLAAEHVKVVLTGEGSDELFAGYSRYRFYVLNERWLKAYRLLPGNAREGIRAFVASSPLFSASVRRKLQHTFVGRQETLEALYLDNFYSAFSAADQGELRASPLPSPDAVYGAYGKRWQDRSGSLLGRMLYADQKTYLVELLMKQDQMSMSCSIESRVPLLDHLLVEFAARVPDHLKLRGRNGKYIFKRAVEDLLPRNIIYRKKMGFPTPLRSWFLDPRAERLFSALKSGGLVSQYVSPRALDSLLAAHSGGIEDATDRLWRLLNLQIWGDVFLTGNRERWIDRRLAARSGTVSP